MHIMRLLHCLTKNQALQTSDIVYTLRSAAGREAASEKAATDKSHTQATVDSKGLPALGSSPPKTRAAELMEMRKSSTFA